MAVVALLVAACSSGAPTRSPSGLASPTNAATSKHSPSDPLAGSQIVHFSATDGVALEGRIFGTGTVGVVLAHGTNTNRQASWYGFTPTLAQGGFRALTFNFRGIDVSVRPLLWRDIVGAVDYLRAQGVEKVFLIGSSLGAHMSLWAAAHPGVDVAGVVAISAGPGLPPPEYALSPTVMGSIHVPTLFLGGTKDETTSPNEVQALYDSANEPKQIALVSSSDHGSALLVGPGAAAEQARQVVLVFLTANS